MKKGVRKILGILHLNAVADYVYSITITKIVSIYYKIREKIIKLNKDIKIAMPWIKCKLGFYWNIKNYFWIFDWSQYEQTDMYVGENTENSKSQYGQDMFVLEKIFNKKHGFFVEVGANDPFELSNSYALEKFGWTGISFEPIEALCSKWKTQRDTPCFPYLLGDQNGETIFLEHNGNDTVYSSVEGFGKPNSSIEYSKKVKKVFRLDGILADKNINVVDVLFLDVEGFELNVLKGLSFDKINVKCIVVEEERTVYGAGNDSVRLFLKKKGFKIVARVGGDDIYCNKKFIKEKAKNKEYIN